MKRLIFALAMALTSVAGTAGAVTVAIDVDILGTSYDSGVGNLTTVVPLAVGSTMDKFSIQFTRQGVPTNIAASTLAPRISFVEFGSANSDGTGNKASAVQWDLFDVAGNIVHSFFQQKNTIPTHLGSGSFPGLGNQLVSAFSMLQLTFLSPITDIGSYGGCRFGFGCNPSMTVELYQPVAPIPVPATLSLMLVGLAGLGWVGRKRRLAAQKSSSR